MKKSGGASAKLFNILVVAIAFFLLIDGVTGETNSHNKEEDIRFSAVSGIGVDERVEPHPRFRVYAYNRHGTFNPSSELYSERVTRGLESSAYRSEALGLKNRYSHLLQSQHRQLGRIIDAVEKGDKEHPSIL